MIQMKTNHARQGLSIIFLMLPLHVQDDDEPQEDGTSVLPLSSCWPKGLLGFLLSTGALIYLCLPASYPWYPRTRLPPLYSKFHQRDLQLPQHNSDTSEGEGKYIWIANQVRGVGWGNYMEEFVLDSFMAHQGGWTNVFSNYTWRQDGPEYSLFQWRKIIPSRIPLSALIAGPLVGGSWPEGDPSPRSVVKEYFDEVCPTRTVINPRDIDRDFPGNGTLSELIERWVQKLNATNARCIEIDRHANELFSAFHGKASRLLDIWPVFSQSPILTHFRWSQLIESAVQSNAHLFSAASPNSNSSGLEPHPYTSIPGLLAIHVRRGDYSRHCSRLAHGRISFMALNSFPEFYDKLVVPSSAMGDEVKQIYQQHCFPTIEEIVDKVIEVRQHQELQGEKLKYLYIMTNGDRGWIKMLQEALKDSGDWSSIHSSRDMSLDWEQRFVAQAADMLIGQRAQVLIGNGFSTLTSNIVMLRMGQGVPFDSIRFW